jgi:cathepsin L
MSFLTATVFFGAGSASAQVQPYEQLELKAPVAVKQKLVLTRKRIQDKKLKFQVGYTYAAERGIKNITGGKIPQVSAADARKTNALASKLVRIDDEARLSAHLPNLQLACNPSARKWDWRRQGKVSPVKRQQCGNCWAYAAMSAFESSYLIRNAVTLDGSEQYIVSNNDNGAGTCDGGYSYKAIEFLVTRGTAPDSVMPDTGNTGSPNVSVETPYDGVAWGWVNESDVAHPSVQDIKTAVCEKGPVSTWIDAGGTFGDYVSGIYDDDDDQQAGHQVGGHFVTIVGWDEDKGSWIIKNSWGQNWGETAGFGSERGYGFITYGTHKVGSYVSWIRAEGRDYKLPAQYYELLPLKRRFPIPGPGPVIRPDVIKTPVIKQNINH